ncbi:MAG: hypothetical protein J5I99_01860, partial [Verrucomicrobia bacterium]|nr:hypothetical protein [Verrucomicrobiota bacterium]
MRDRNFQFQWDSITTPARLGTVSPLHHPPLRFLKESQSRRGQDEWDGLWTALELSGTMNPYDNRPTDPFAMDSDGDGLSDSAEMAQASDPL